MAIADGLVTISAYSTREMTQFSSHYGGLSGSCLACWCCTFILADSDFKNKTIDINLFRYDVILIAMQSLCHITLYATLLTVCRTR